MPAVSRLPTWPRRSITGSKLKSGWNAPRPSKPAGKNDKESGRCLSAAQQNPHRPGIALALRWRARVRTRFVSGSSPVYARGVDLVTELAFPDAWAPLLLHRQRRLLDGDGLTADSMAQAGGQRRDLRAYRR